MTGITVKPGQDSIHELIIWKVNPFVASVTCSRYQIAFKWWVNFWLQFLVYDEMKNILMDEISIWTFFKLARKLSRQKFHNELAWVFTAHYASKNADWNQQRPTNGGVLANRKSANHPYCFLSNQKKIPDSGFFACDLWRNVSCPLPRVVQYSQIDSIGVSGYRKGLHWYQWYDWYQ